MVASIEGTGSQVQYARPRPRRTVDMPRRNTRDVIHLACRKRVHFELHPCLQHFAYNHVSDSTVSQQLYVLYCATYNECADLDGWEQTL